MDDATLARFADLVVGFGANVQPDQIVAIGCEPGKEYLVRALAASAYRHGAKFVDVAWFDPHVKRARIEHARARDARLRAAVVRRAHARARRAARRARRALGPDARPGLLADLDPALVGRDRLPTAQGGDARSSTTARRTGRSCPCPTQAWADARLPRPRAGGGAGAAGARAAPRPAARRGRPDRRLAGARRHARRAAPSGSPSAASTPCTTRARGPT